MTLEIDFIRSPQDDEALQKYKMALLGQAAGGSGTVVVDESDPRKVRKEQISVSLPFHQVIVKALALVVEGRDDEVIDLTQSLEEIKKRSFTLKEGVKFRIRIDFMVQREIVHGLKYVQKTLKMSIPVDKMTHMVGSYAPKTEVQSYLTPPEDAPSGMMKRGTYSINSLFTDDDKSEHLKWEWSLEIKKDWA